MSHISPMKVLIALPRLYPSKDAAASHIRLLIRGLREAGAHVSVIALGEAATGTDVSKTASGEAEHITVAVDKSSLLGRAKSFLFAPEAIARAVSRRLSKGDIDVVITYGQSYRTARSLTKACQLCRTPLVGITTENWPFAVDMPFLALDNWLFRRLIQPRFAGVLAISEWLERDAHKSGVPALLLPALGDPSLPLQGKLSLGDGDFNLVYVGTLFRRDLPATLLEGFRRFALDHTRASLTVIGNLSSSEGGQWFADQIRRDPFLSTRVNITGWVSDEELNGHMSRASAFVILRNDDQISRACFPFRLFRFMMTGRPVILSATGEPMRLYGHLSACLKIPPGHHPDDLAAALDKLIRDPRLAERIGLAGRQQAAKLQDYAAHGRAAHSFLQRVTMAP
jgi:glycosyltransferase involved in cell wall biosynthesis